MDALNGPTSVLESVLYLTDSYKVTHHKQYPKDTTHVYSYFECRGGKFPKTVFFGLQYILKRWMVGPVVTKAAIYKAKEFYKEHFGADFLNYEGWIHILERHKGYLPLRIRAVPEGSVVDTRNVLITVENTDPKVPWLTNWFETLLVQVWYPLTVATNSRAQKEMIAKYLTETADSLDSLLFKLHDFGYRGSTCVEAAAIGGAAHLVNFRGTDTVAGLVLARQYYNSQMAGFSIPASEHSTMTSWGREHEADACRNMLEQYPRGTVACVSDSYDIFACCSQVWGEKLRPLVEERGARGGALVIRPDSGHPPTVVLKVLEILGEKFGTSTNKKGFKELPKHVRVIQGDGMSYETLGEILGHLKAHGWGADNVAFGSGGALLQRLDRDTQKCAFKCSYVVVAGSQRDVYKDPVTDPGKKSKKGRLTLEKNELGQFVTRTEGRGDPKKDILQLVYENGRLLKEYTFEEIRQNAEISHEFYNGSKPS